MGKSYSDTHLSYAAVSYRNSYFCTIEKEVFKSEDRGSCSIHVFSIVLKFVVSFVINVSG